MFAKSHDDINRVYEQVGTIKRLSDRVVGLGPFGIGLDGILTWIPGAGLVYSIGASVIILIHGLRARMDLPTFLMAVGVLFVDNSVSSVPVVGSAADLFFQGHLYAAKLVQNYIDKTHYVAASKREAHASGAHADHVAAMKAMKGKKRVIYLHP